MKHEFKLLAKHTLVYNKKIIRTYSSLTRFLQLIRIKEDFIVSNEFIEDSYCANNDLQTIGTTRYTISDITTFLICNTALVKYFGCIPENLYFKKLCK